MVLRHWVLPKSSCDHCNAEHHQQKGLICSTCFLPCLHLVQSQPVTTMVDRLGSSLKCQQAEKWPPTKHTAAGAGVYQGFAWLGISRLCFHGSFDYHTFQKDKAAFTEVWRRRHWGNRTPLGFLQTSQPSKMPTHPFMPGKSLFSAPTENWTRSWPEPYLIWTSGKTKKGTKDSMCHLSSLPCSGPAPEGWWCNQTQEKSQLWTENSNIPLLSMKLVQWNCGVLMEQREEYTHFLHLLYAKAQSMASRQNFKRGGGKKKVVRDTQEVHLLHLLNFIPTPFFYVEAI